MAGIEAVEFVSGVLDSEPPVGSGPCRVPFRYAGADGSLQAVLIAVASAQAGPGQHAELDLRHPFDKLRTGFSQLPCLGGSQTRVCDTGPQVTPFSLFRCGSQTYSAIRTSWRESDARYLRLRPHQPLQGLRAVGQRPVNPTTAVAGCRRGAFSHLSGHRRLRNFRNQQPVGLALSGLLVGPGRHLGCGVHRPHRAALAGHHGQHPRPATSRGEDSQPGR